MPGPTGRREPIPDDRRKYHASSRSRRFQHSAKPIGQINSDGSPVGCRERTKPLGIALNIVGDTVSIPVPAQLQNSQWMIANSTPDAFTVVRYLPSDNSLYAAAVSWNPFTGRVTELIHSATASEAILAVLPWGAQQY